ncbi:hemagglutinin repeat-containing protein [Paraburkholderia strydomiana]|uniref:hemagglutinin repeat-containing protein n=1 Tax=Paraburkholderia strydomiana TaxID=1245417 RepID=UPI0038BB174F
MAIDVASFFTALSGHSQSNRYLPTCLTMSAGQDLHITGSEVIAAQNVSGKAANVIIDAATNTSHHDDSREMKQSGFTLGLSGSGGGSSRSGER